MAKLAYADRETGPTDHPTSSASAATQRPPIDLAHLRRFTLGDRMLEAEVLDLFEQQASDVVTQLASATDRRDWAMAAHTIKGSARAVGAFEVATLAEKLETEGPSGARSHRLIDEVASALCRARRFIADNRASLPAAAVPGRI